MGVFTVNVESRQDTITCVESSTDLVIALHSANAVEPAGNTVPVGDVRAWSQSEPVP